VTEQTRRVRRARQGDIPGIIAVLAANDESVTEPDRPGSRYLEHVLRHGLAVVADRGGDVVGFAATVETPAGAFLTDLYVAPGEQGRGAGGALLDRVWPAAGPRMTFSSDDPRALPLYVRSGMSAWWPLLYLVRTDVGSTGDAGGWTVEPVDGAEAARFEHELAGSDRSRDWALWGSRPGSTAFAVRRRRRLGGVGYADGSDLGRLVLARDADPVETVLATVALAPRGPLKGLAIPGPHPALRHLLERGWRIDARDTYMASEPDLLDPVRLLPDPSFG
jgi:GNAT superfamily N-acetyltransferase